MINAFIWTILFSIATAISIVLLGQRDLISGNLLSFQKILTLIFNWRFIVSMLFAVIARISFIMTNNAILKIPKLVYSSTTITTLATTSIGLIFIILANYFFLEEKINLIQGIGAFIILIGIFLITK